VSSDQQSGTLAALGSGFTLLGWLELAVSPQDAQRALVRAPDFADERVVSWGRLTLSEVERLVGFETDDVIRDEALHTLHEWLGRQGLLAITLYYGPCRGD